MYTRILPLLALLVASPVLAALDALEEAYELRLGEVTLPAHAASQVVIRECQGCEPTVLSVDGRTTYHVDPATRSVPLSQFQAAAGRARDGLIVVFYAPDTGRVTRIVLTPVN